MLQTSSHTIPYSKVKGTQREEAMKRHPGFQTSITILALPEDELDWDVLKFYNSSQLALKYLNVAIFTISEEKKN